MLYFRRPLSNIISVYKAGETTPARLALRKGVYRTFWASLPAGVPNPPSNFTNATQSYLPLVQ